jgi:hypothetical protein
MYRCHDPIGGACFRDRLHEAGASPSLPASTKLMRGCHMRPASQPVTSHCSASWRRPCREQWGRATGPTLPVSRTRSPVRAHPSQGVGHCGLPVPPPVSSPGQRQPVHCLRPDGEQQRPLRAFSIGSAHAGPARSAALASGAVLHGRRPEGPAPMAKQPEPAVRNRPATPFRTSRSCLLRTVAPSASLTIRGLMIQGPHFALATGAWRSAGTSRALSHGNGPCRLCT